MFFYFNKNLYQCFYKENQMKIYWRILLKKIFFLLGIFTVLFAHSAYCIIEISKEELEKMPPLYRYIITSHKTIADEQEVRNIIQTYGKDLDLSNGMGTDTVLHLLIRLGGFKNLNLAREILNTLNVDVNEYYEYTLLHEAAHSSNPSAVIMLVDEFKANVNAVDSRGKGIFTTPLHIAAFYGAIQTIRALVNRGADINATNNLGQIPLHIAVFGNAEAETVSTRRSIFRLLINNNMNAQDKKGQTPLHLAAFYGMPNSAKTLLALGANAQIKDIEGNIPYDVAKKKDVKNILKLGAILVRTPHEIINSWTKKISTWCRNAFSKKGT